MINVRLTTIAELMGIGVAKQSANKLFHAFFDAMSAALIPPSRVWSTRTFDSVDPPIRALVIDDDKDFAQALAAALELEGFDVQTADCVECFEITRHWMPSVVLLDMEMPIMNGFRVAQELRKLTHCTRVPIIAHTSLSEDDVLVQGMPAGIDAYCRKGNSPQVLVSLLRLVTPGRALND
jgi:two-component system, cell cycle response regulator DivK